jgi:hypothetical protein
MLKLMIECSRTGRLISTGIETDARSFACLTTFQARTFCPDCNRNHVWSKNEVCLELNAPPPSADSNALH